MSEETGDSSIEVSRTDLSRCQYSSYVDSGSPTRRRYAGLQRCFLKRLPKGRRRYPPSGYPRRIPATSMEECPTS